MVFMSDSDRAASLAKDCGINLGLHLNLNQTLTLPNARYKKLTDHHNKVLKYLNSNKYNQLLYNPFIRNSLNYVFQAQIEEYARLYDHPPIRIDGHRHMHLCANLFFSSLFPKDIFIRSSFTFLKGQKSWINRAYRKFLNRKIKKNNSSTDYFFSLSQALSNSHLGTIIEISQNSTVELMTHPEHATEKDFLLSREFSELTASAQRSNFRSLQQKSIHI